MSEAEPEQRSKVADKVTFPATAADLKVFIAVAGTRPGPVRQPSDSIDFDHADRPDQPDNA